MVNLYILHTANMDDPREHKEWKQLLPEGRWEKAVRMVLPEDRKNSAGAGWLMRYAFREKGFFLEKEHLYLGKHGKPKHKIVHFNVSHSGEYVICVTAEKEIGCDIQKITTVREKIMNRFFSPEEKRYVWQGGENATDTKAERFTRIWTRKESYVKRSGEGLTGDLREIPCLDGHDFYEQKRNGYLLSVCYEDVGKKSDGFREKNGNDQEETVRVKVLHDGQVWGID